MTYFILIFSVIFYEVKAIYWHIKKLQNVIFEAVFETKNKFFLKIIALN